MQHGIRMKRLSDMSTERLIYFRNVLHFKSVNLIFLKYLVHRVQKATDTQNKDELRSWNFKFLRKEFYCTTN